MKDENNIVDSDCGWFEITQHGSYRRNSLLDEED